MSNDLQVLADNRDALLLAEVAAWLHMLGKIHEDFLGGNLDLAEKIPDDIHKDHPALYDLLTDTWVGKVWNMLSIKEFQSPGLSINSILETHQHIRECKEGFLRLFADAHGRGSGTEKGVLARFAPSQKSTVYLSTSLGYETNASIDLTKLHDERQDLYQFLEERLNILKANNANLSLDEWQRFRSQFNQRVERSFQKSVAETRRPLNDVTLLDQTMASVAFFKATLAYNLLQGWKEPLTDIIADKYRWRLLRIGLDGLAFWANSLRISDILARKNLITEALDKVNTLLEDSRSQPEYCLYCKWAVPHG
jgi:hypothetical protein